MARGLTNYGDTGFSLFLRKAFIKGAGYTDDALSRPIIGIVNTGSSYNPCHGNAPQLIEAVKRGVMLAGGLPMDFPTISVHESFAADQHVPAQPHVHGHRGNDPRAAHGRRGADRRLRQDGAGPAHGRGLGRRAGDPAGDRLDADRIASRRARRRLHRLPALLGRYRAEEIDAEEIADVNNQLVASVGTCSVMGTASTMACLTEALGMMVAGGASAPAVTADRVRVAEHTGASAVALARSRLTPDRIITGKSIENAARAAGHRRLDQWHRPPDRHRRPTGHRHRPAGLDRMSRETPVLVDLKPSGQHYMEDFHHAGGMPRCCASCGRCCTWTR